LDTQVKKFNHRPHNSNSNPIDLYLRRDKLWFIRSKDGPEFAPFVRPHEPVPPPDPLKDDLIISYYDLSQACPIEIQVDEIKLAIIGLPEISSLSWVQDLIIVQLTETKFDIFDLDKGAWLPEAIHYRLIQICLIQIFLVLADNSIVELPKPNTKWKRNGGLSSHTFICAVTQSSLTTQLFIF
jgi:hypothetical protein